MSAVFRVARGLQLRQPKARNHVTRQDGREFSESAAMNALRALSAVIERWRLRLIVKRRLRDMLRKESGRRADPLAFLHHRRAQ